MPTSSYSKFNQYAEDLHHGVHDFSSHSLKVALCAAANAPVASNSVLADLTTVSEANLASNALSISSEGQTAGTYNLIIADKTLTASGGAVGPFRYVVIYNSTPSSPANPLIGWHDYGADITLQDGESLLLDMDDANGLFSFT